MGTSNRQERVCPDEVVLVFNDGKEQWHIPAGVHLAQPNHVPHTLTLNRRWLG